MKNSIIDLYIIADCAFLMQNLDGKSIIIRVRLTSFIKIDQDS